MLYIMSPTHEVDAEDESEDLLFFLCKLDALAGVVHPYHTIVIDKLDDGLSPEQAQWLVDVFRPLVHKTSQLVYRIGDEVRWVEGE